MVPCRLRLDNFLSYSETELDFTGIEAAIVTGPNGHGKSSLIDGMLYALFGNARTNSADQLVRAGETDMRTELEFALGEGKYRVARCRSTKGQGKTILTFDRWNAGRWQSLAGSSVADTQRRIESTLCMDFRTLVNASIMMQGNSGEFTQADPADRKKVLARILNLEIYQQAAELAKETVRQLGASIRTARTIVENKKIELEGRAELAIEESEMRYVMQFNAERLTDGRAKLSELEETRHGLALAEAQVKGFRDQREGYRNERESLQAALQSLKAQAKGVEGRLANRKQIEADALAYRRAYDQLVELDAIGKQLAVLSLKTAKAEQAAQGLIHERREALSTAQAVYDALRSDLEADKKRVRAELLRCNEDAARLDSVPCADTELQVSCELLSAAVKGRDMVSGLVKESQDIEGAILSLYGSPEGRAVAVAQKELNAANPHTKEAGQLRDEIERIGFDPRRQAELMETTERLAPAVDAISELAVAEAELGGITNSIQEKTLRLAQTEDALGQLQSSLNGLADVEEQIENLGFSIAQLKKAIAEDEHTASKYGSAYYEVKSKLVHLDAVAEEVAEMESRIGRDEHIVGEHSELQQMFGRNGIQAMLIERAVPQIEDAANEILGRIAPGFSVRLDTQRPNKGEGIRETLDVVVCDGDSARAYELFSGGEKFRIDFAVRLALSRLLTYRAGARLESLIIDEGFGSQDSEGLDRLLECLNAVRDEFRFLLLVTHIEEMKDAFPTQISVTRDGDGSKANIIQGG